MFRHNDAKPHRPVNWTAEMPREFRRLRGYDLLPMLPALAGYVVESQEYSTWFLNDFRRTLADLIAGSEHFARGQGVRVAPRSGARAQVLDPPGTGLAHQPRRLFLVGVVGVAVEEADRDCLDLLGLVQFAGRGDHRVGVQRFADRAIVADALADLADGFGELDDVRVDLVADDGAIIYLNGVEVQRDNVGAGTDSATLLAASNRSGSTESQVRTFTIPPELVQVGTNVIAVSVHQDWEASSDLSFDAALRSTAAG